MVRHMMPNVIATYIVLMTITLGFAIVVEASLSFLGDGLRDVLDPRLRGRWRFFAAEGAENAEVFWDSFSAASAFLR